MSLRVTGCESQILLQSQRSHAQGQHEAVKVRPGALHRPRQGWQGQRSYKNGNTCGGRTGSITSWRRRRCTLSQGRWSRTNSCTVDIALSKAKKERSFSARMSSPGRCSHSSLSLKKKKIKLMINN